MFFTAYWQQHRETEEIIIQQELHTQAAHVSGEEEEEEDSDSDRQDEEEKEEEGSSSTVSLSNAFALLGDND